MVFLVLILVVAVPLLLWSIIDPKGSWRTLEGWKYRDPDANEPSEASYALSRIGGVVALVAIVIAGFVLYNGSQENRERERQAQERELTRTPYERPTYDGPRSLDLEGGTLIGYRYPSELTVEFIVLQGPSNGGLGTSCTTGLTVYEHTNALVVRVFRSARDYSFSGSEPTDDEIRAKCENESPYTVTRKLKKPIGDRPILTAAPLADPAAFDLAYGPAVRPQPLEEVPQPGVVQPQHPVSIDPAWQPVPLLAAATHD